jgi:anti-sigma B factor antagonist
MASFAEPQFELFEDEVDERTHVIAVSGEIHVSTAPQFSHRLNDAIGQGKTAVVLDLADVSFIDSTGLSVLLNGLRRVTRSGGRMALVCTNPTVLRLFEITRLDTTFEIVSSREAAIAAVRGAGGDQDGVDGPGSSAGAP